MDHALAGRRREPDANTTVTYGLVLAPTTPAAERCTMLSYQGERRPSPTTSHVGYASHNPKVAGSNPAPATK